MAFDAGAGISEDEQRDILEQINRIAEKNRLALSSSMTETAGAAGKFKAKKTGGLFPILVNFFAVAALAGGFLMLHASQAEADAHAREGSRVFTDTERALIEEIRSQAGAYILARDIEIAGLLDSLAAIEAQLGELAAAGGDLPPEMLALQARLRAQQEEQMAALASAREDRARAMSDARSQEVALQAQLDARARAAALAGDEAQGGAEAEAPRERGAAVEAAREELARLSGEQALAERMEGQMAGLFSAISRQVSDGDLDGAAGAVEGLRAILGGSGLQGLRGMQARIGLYDAAAATLETLIASADTNAAREISRLQAELGEAAREAAGLAERDEGAAEAAALLEGSIAALESANAALALQVGALQSSLAARTQEAESSRQASAQQQQQISALSQAVSARDTTIRALQEQGDSKERDIAALSSQLAQIRQLLQAMAGN